MSLSVRAPTLLLWAALALAPAAHAAPATPLPKSQEAVSTLLTRYAGTLPCADCAGIRMDLTLVHEAESGQPREFRLRETYLATRDGDQSFDSRGEYALTRAGNGRTQLWLDPQNKENRRGFLFDDSGERSALVMLDRNGRRIKSAFSYRLDRVPTSRLVLPGRGEIMLPARFDGDDADGTGGNDLALDLREDGTYVFRVAIGGGVAPYTDFGTFRFNAEGTRLTLFGGSEVPHRFGLVDARTLLRLDNDDRLQRPARELRMVEYAEVEDPLQLVGQLSYQADAPFFRECATGRTWPVAASGDYPTLERAYGALRGRLKLKPGAPLRAAVEARLVRQTGTEESQPPQPTLVVERFERLDGVQACPARLGR